ncbi:phosphatidylinositol N-acetylglucosaminyltransferase subunit Y-like [Monodelphis domestica]|uniref:phosphatidylinositol N-acetylglucosaminyltransferase subunit Y-like n=1 Tax=Monodelphis domestica TaxID=13616 RepID=UPI0024E1C99D|nr:phosphatidylinositol N-acetylglucosaminyltransferase subunit Y-like [Monodelphis domestica]
MVQAGREAEARGPAASPTMLLSLPTLTVLVPLISLGGLIYSASVEDDFPHGCTSTSSLCFYSLLLPVLLPVCVILYLWTWTQN